MKKRIQSIWISIILSFISIPDVYTQTEYSQELQLFETYRGGVFSVWGAGYGSGFLFDSSGLVLTNDHIIGNSTDIRVQLDDSTKVAGTLVGSDTAADIAIILINRTLVQGRPVLRFAGESGRIGTGGERVMAIGCPYHQMKEFATGVAGRVQDEALLSTVALSDEYSGGPLLTMDGMVTGINYSHHISDGNPSRITGSRLLSLAHPFIDSVLSMKETLNPPSADLLPTMPRKIFPDWGLKVVPSQVDKDPNIYNFPYNFPIKTDLGISGMTFIPPHLLYKKEKEQRYYRNIKTIEGDEKKLYEANDKMISLTQYDCEFTPVVQMIVAPFRRVSSPITTKSILSAVLGTIGMTAGTAMGGTRFLANTPQMFYSGSTRYDATAGLPRVSMFVNGEKTTDIERKARYTWGRYLLSGEMFARRGDSVPSIDFEIIFIGDSGIPMEPQMVRMAPKIVEQISLDLEPYFYQIEADMMAEGAQYDESGMVIPGIRRGTVKAEVDSLFGRPDRFFTMHFGRDTYTPWEGLVYRYFGPENPKYQNLKVRYVNTYVFNALSVPPTLSHYNIEYEQEVQTGKR